jgi:hypothetical protein
MGSVLAASMGHLGSRIRYVSVILLILVALLQQGLAQVTESGGQDPPTFTGPSRLICPFAGPFLHVASASTGPEGLLVRISPPTKARYSEGAPIAVHVNASTRVDGSRAGLSDQGFIDVSFLCPGGQYKATDGTIRKSGGQAGPPTPPQECVEPLADVLSFATGQIRSVEGKSIQDYAGAVKALTDNAGVIGWAAGGNLAVLAMARHGERFPRLRWYGSFESPFLGTVDVGFSTMFQAHPFYDPATGSGGQEWWSYGPGGNDRRDLRASRSDSLQELGASVNASSGSIRAVRCFSPLRVAERMAGRH